ncbi:Uncharacterised protein r2_g2819 [Pycnogonum litorale]
MIFKFWMKVLFHIAFLYIGHGFELLPEFAEKLPNQTVRVGKDVSFTCLVNNLGDHQVGWFHVEKKQVLAIHKTLITRNYRVTLSSSDSKHWTLHIKNVKEEDRGQYMCQINTIPMKSHSGFLDVVVPPDIIDEETTSDVVVQEGSNVSLRCRATGYPDPSITWQREDGTQIPMGKWNGKAILQDEYDGEDLNITRVSRLHMGAYLCIASNNVRPPVSRTIKLQVNFPPMLWIPHQLIGAPVGSEVTINCHSEAFPNSINFWKTADGTMIVSDNEVQATSLVNEYKTHMRLKILNVRPKHFGEYKCIAKNPMGDTEGSIRLYEIPSPTTKSIHSPSKKSLHGQSKALASRKNRLMDSHRESDGEVNDSGRQGGPPNAKESTNSKSSSTETKEALWKLSLIILLFFATTVNLESSL